MTDNFGALSSGICIFILFDWALKSQLSIFITVHIFFNRPQFVLAVTMVIEAPTCLAQRICQIHI